MANKIELQVDIKTQLQDALKTSREGTGKLKNAGAFNSTVGEKVLQNILGILNRLEQVDLENLSGTEFTHFLTNLEKLRGMMDSAARSLTEYSEEFKKQQKVVDEASKALREAKDTKSTKLQAKREALEQLKTQTDPSKRKHKFYNIDTGKEVFNPDTLAELYSNKKLKITGLKGAEVKDFEARAAQYGISKYAKASQELEAANTNIKTKTAELQAEELKLTDIEKPLGVHPLTEEINKQSKNVLNTTGGARDFAQKEDEENIKNTTQAISSQIRTLDGQSSALGKAFKQFTIYNIAVRGAKKAIREAVNTIKELDKELTEQAMVTGMTRKQAYQLIGTYQDLAIQSGATTKEIASVATEYMKQGKTIEDSLVLTEAAVKAAKVARVSVGDSVNYLTTALNGFRLSAEDAMRVSDKFAAVAAASATDYDELAIALSKVASQANLAGMSIDYTTALLTKGLETTREAPETMGTALKTIISRMRELSDYGETLEGDTDINNVESQLAYIGIALRDNQGELRSTEDVLDELGHKWDDLNKNQQAAVAKALAGTRQQSRLIAMMEDYERVIELQEISERSAGTTVAQAETLLQGMEAALNKISVSWEKISTTLVNSEAIIGIVNFGADVLGGIGNILDTTAGQIGVFSTLAVIGTNILGQKIREHTILKAEADLEKKKIVQKQEEYIQTLELAHTKDAISQLEKAQNEENIASKEYESALDNKKIAAEEYLLAVKNKILKQDELASAEKELANNEELAQEKKITAEKYKQILAENPNDANARSEMDKAQSEYNQLQKTIKANKDNLKQKQKELKTANTKEKKARKTLLTAQNNLKIAKQTLDTKQAETQEARNQLKIKEEAVANDEEINREKAKLNLFKEQNGMVSETFKLLTNVASIGSAIVSLSKLLNKEKLKELISQKLGLSLEKAKTLEMWKQIGTAMLFVFYIAAAAALVYGIVKAIHSVSADGIADSINKLSTEINTLTEQANGLEKITNAYDKLNNKILKTAADQEEMNNLLAQAEEYLSEKDLERYKSLTTEIQKRNFLLEKQAEYNNQQLADRQKQMEIWNKSSDRKKRKILENKQNKEKYTLVQDAITSNAMYYTYTGQDSLDNYMAASGMIGDASIAGDIVRDLMSKMSVEELADYASDPSGLKAKEIMEQLVSATTVDSQGKTKQSIELMNDTNAALEDRVRAYKDSEQSLRSYNEELANSFALENRELEFFSNWSEAAWEAVSSLGLTYDSLSELIEGFKEAGISMSEEDWIDNMEELVVKLRESGGKVRDSIKEVFGDDLEITDELLDNVSKEYAKVMQQGILNMGQEMDKIKNTTNSFYEKAAKWSEMTDTEKNEFIADNAEMFKGEGGVELLNAFNKNDWDKIGEALSKNEGFTKSIQKRIEAIKLEIEAEKALGDEANKAYIAKLEQDLKYLEDSENLFKASLEVRLEQQDKELEQYKSYLEEEREALQDSLEKRKEAYEEYFDAINQNEEDEDYEEQADLLISNLAKLGSSSDAASIKQSKEMEKQLEELEAERLKELRERAQEAIIENIDDQLDQISEKFDKLLENNQELLTLMRQDFVKDGGANMLSGMIANQVEGGVTALGLQDFIGNLDTTFGRFLSEGADLDSIKVSEENNQLVLNVNGQTYALDPNNEQSLYAAIMKALNEVGVR